MTDEDTFMGFSDGLSQSGTLHHIVNEGGQFRTLGRRVPSFSWPAAQIRVCLFAVVSAEVEMTAYGLLTYTLLGDVASALPVVKWLSQQRNSLGGFSSTQVALLFFSSGA